MSKVLNILIVCGGKGTRISGILGSTPKVLAPIGRHTFLDYILSWINSSFHGIDRRVYFLTGIGHHYVSNFIKARLSNAKLIPEPSPLGTLGAVFHALDSLDDGPVLVLNGDTLIDIDLSQPFNNFLSDQSQNLLLVKTSILDGRYGGFNLVNQRLRRSNVDPTFVSMGAFFTDKEKLLIIRHQNLHQHGQLMLDEDFLDKSPTRPYILDQEVSFIDIGIPEDYARAQTFIPQLIDL